MFDLLIQLLVFCCIFGLIWWVLQQVPLPDPVGRIARVIFVAIGCLILIYMLLGLVGHGPRLGRF